MAKNEFYLKMTFGSKKGEVSVQVPVDEEFWEEQFLVDEVIHEDLVPALKEKCGVA